MPSAKSKAAGFSRSSTPPFDVGDLVFIKGDKVKLKAREKCLVIGGEPDSSCQLRKFTSSTQFRSKVYTVPMCDCYPVTPTVLSLSPQGPILSQPSNIPSDSDDEPDPVVHSLKPSTARCSPVGSHTAVSSPCPVSTAHSELSAEKPPPIPEGIATPLSPTKVPLEPPVPNDAPQSPDNSISTRKSNRTRRFPFWHNRD